ncbi:MAG TPA: tRNA preQ1(34) S-adenosylmethionine ribosyltransferase-isomerase QueA [Polyangia bacterium]
MQRGTRLETANFEYLLPPECIAAAPAKVRDTARLLILDRANGARKHARFLDLLEHLPPASLLVLNDTRVFPARLRGRKASGGGVEFLLTRCILSESAEPGRFCERWEALTRGLGMHGLTAAIDVGGGVQIEPVERRPGGGGLVTLRASGPGESLLAALEEIGEIPLPPYIEAARRRAGHDAPVVDDRARYQTVYAAAPGAVAAPTAGLHFTPELLASAVKAGHEIAFVTLDVGPGTFRPVKTDDPEEHRMEAERFRISPEAATAIARARAAGRRVVAVGTTVVRTLEASAREHGGAVVAGEGATDLFLLPGARFEVVTDLITNFHLPRSTLLMLVAAFAGRERVLEAYQEAVRLGYRFYSYGDAMFITGAA